MEKKYLLEKCLELKEYNQSESLIKHALAVEGVMRHFAELFGEDQNGNYRRSRFRL